MPWTVHVYGINEAHNPTPSIDHACYELPVVVFDKALKSNHWVSHEH